MNSSNPDHLLDSYDYVLPEHLIAQRPIDPIKRDHSKLLVYNAQTKEVIHDYFYNIDRYLPTNSLLVFNQSKVYPSRLLGQKNSGGKCEVFFLSLTPKNEIYPVLIKTRSKKNLHDEYFFPDGLKAKIEHVYDDGTFGIKLILKNENDLDLESYLNKYALIPIPPYIRGGESDDSDQQNYQTIYSKELGSVAAPTAGLHFTNTLFEKLNQHQIKRAFVTLHVGLGTFRPVATEEITEHKMHTEKYYIDETNLREIRSSQNVFAVGTTSLRVLESSFNKEMRANEIYETDIFLYPGKEILSVKGLITNFHLPKSSLLMLVSSLIGREKTLELYKIAIENNYRFFSYGDAMLIVR